MTILANQLLYKGKWRHCEITLAPRFYPSSKLCSNCQNVNAKLKREHHWQCPACGTKHERNKNAAVNLRNLLTLPTGSGVTPSNERALFSDTLGGETVPSDLGKATRESKTQAPLTVNEQKVYPSTRRVGPTKSRPVSRSSDGLLEKNVKCALSRQLCTTFS